MLAAADLFLWPERTHPAFGLVGLEAMLMGTPVLAARRGAIPEVVDAASGWVHEPESPGALAAALEPLLREPEKLAERAEGLRERTLRRFAPATMARRTLEVYRELF
jgi:glycosyltransferase involved in cell wall biosynthesis